jgi:hypothetical protein
MRRAESASDDMLEGFNDDFDQAKKLWKDSEGRSILLAHLRQIGQDHKITKCICVGLGSLLAFLGSRNYRGMLLRMLMQLAAFLDISELRESNPIAWGSA